MRPNPLRMGCVILSKAVNLSEPQLPLLHNGGGGGNIPTTPGLGSGARTVTSAQKLWSVESHDWLGLGGAEDGAGPGQTCYSNDACFASHSRTSSSEGPKQSGVIIPINKKFRVGGFLSFFHGLMTLSETQVFSVFSLCHTSFLMVTRWLPLLQTSHTGTTVSTEKERPCFPHISFFFSPSQTFCSSSISLGNNHHSDFIMFSLLFFIISPSMSSMYTFLINLLFGLLSTLHAGNRIVHILRVLVLILPLSVGFTNSTARNGGLFF